LSFNFFIEIGCEEIPHPCLNPILEQLQRLFAAELGRVQLAFRNLATFATPRRLIVAIDEMVDRQPNRTELIIGPPYSAAYTSGNTPTPAIQGFVRKHGVALEQLKCVETDKGEYLGFHRETLGKSARDILPALILSITSALDFPKRMKWNDTQFSFVRPIRWLVCLLNGEVIPLELAGLSSSKTTFGHRILTRNAVIEVSNFEEFKSGLFNLKVQIDPVARRNSISSLLESAARENGGNLLRDDLLLNSVVHLNEWPSVICGAFDSSYLRLPREVLVMVMREHQKYFSLEDDERRLLPRFLAVVDGDSAYHLLIASGHERVLKSRLADASFFWDSDIKVRLEDRLDKLKTIKFHEKLGTVYDKTRRLRQLAEFVSSSIKRRDLLPDVTLAATLCKADLTTEMVREFTDLQGVMGGLYAKSQDIRPAVADAIYDHYRPTTLEDESPRNLGGAVLSFSDKLDSVIAAFSVGLVPTGSRDPLALRRQTQGLTKVLLDHKLSLSLKRSSFKAYSILKRMRLPERSFEETFLEFEKFVKDRLKFLFKESGYRYDEVNAIVEVDCDNPIDCLERLAALSAVRKSPDFDSLALSFKRIKNIIQKAGLSLDGPFSFDPRKFEADEEKSLHLKIESLLPGIRRAQKRHAYDRAFELMASLRPEVDLFFDKVLVMAEDPSVRANRLGFLGSLLMIFKNTADISEVVAG
jgi:glycyl-tRNA synthetase beta chain